MEPSLLLSIENSGYKKKHIAKKLGVTPTYLYLCMKGQRILSRKKEENLKNLLQHAS